MDWAWWVSYLTLAPKTGHQAGETPVGGTIVDSMLSQEAATSSRFGKIDFGKIDASVNHSRRGHRMVYETVLTSMVNHVRVDLMRYFPVAGAVAMLGCFMFSAADAADNIHVRGIVTAVDGSKVTVKTREGKDVSLMLGDNWKIGGVTKASMADIKKDTFIGTANMVGPDGAKALEVVVFPDSMRGTGEGDYGWDLKPKSQMTNATVKNEVQGVDGQTVTLAYKGGEKKVTIAPDTPIVMIGGATPADIKPGAAVFMSAAPGASPDMLDKGFIAVGKDGAVPPM